VILPLRAPLLLLFVALVSASPRFAQAWQSAETSRRTQPPHSAPAPSPIPRQAQGHAIGPLVARLVVLDGAVLRSGARRLYVELSNRETRSIEGSVRVLATEAWDVTPTRSFSFRLRPGETTQRQLAVSLPSFASPGTYDLALRVEVGGRDLGTLRTRAVKPIDWLVVGPFAKPPPGTQLPPERGVNLDGVYDGLGGLVEWRTIPEVAFDASGGVELDLVYPSAGRVQCACAFTAFETGHASAIRWSIDGIERVYLNGFQVGIDSPAHLIQGRNSLLVRVCGRGDTWRMRLAMLAEDGSWLRDFDNDLATLLDAFDAMRRGRVDTSGSHQTVTFEYRDPQATSVDVLGAFNAWVPLTLERVGAGVWKRDLLLPHGRYAYKLLVDGHLILDPGSTRTEADGFGGRNSILIVR
jgi:hypothetical protein